MKIKEKLQPKTPEVQEKRKTQSKQAFDTLSEEQHL